MAMSLLCRPYGYVSELDDRQGQHSHITVASWVTGAFFFLSAPVAFRRVALETPEWTSRDSNHHRQSVSAGKTNAIPTEPLGRLMGHWCSGSDSSFVELNSDGQYLAEILFLRTAWDSLRFCDAIH